MHVYSKFNLFVVVFVSKASGEIPKTQLFKAGTTNKALLKTNPTGLYSTNQGLTLPKSKD